MCKASASTSVSTPHIGVLSPREQKRWTRHLSLSPLSVGKRPVTTNPLRRPTSVTTEQLSITMVMDQTCEDDQETTDSPQELRNFLVSALALRLFQHKIIGGNSKKPLTSKGTPGLAMELPLRSSV